MESYELNCSTWMLPIGRSSGGERREARCDWNEIRTDEDMMERERESEVGL